MKKAHKETHGSMRVCSVCDKMGRERNTDPDIKHWCCSVDCAEKQMKEPGWGSIGWLKM